MSDILPFLQYIAVEWNLNLSKVCDFKIAKKILINSTINN